MAAASGQQGVAGVVGAGLMGRAVCARLRAAGLDVSVFDVDPAKAAALAPLGARPVASIAALSACPVIVLAVFNTDQVEAVIEGSGGILENTPAGQASPVVICTSTCDPDRLAALDRRQAPRGLRLLEVPVSGTSRQVADGAGVGLVGGDRATMASVAPVLDAICPERHYLGAVGNGSRAKLAVNLILGLNRAAMAEGLVFAERLGLEREAFLAVARGSAAYSSVMETKGPLMARRQFREPQSRVDQSLKDFHLMIEQARAAGQQLPFAEVYARMLERCVARDEGEWDNAVIVEAIARCTPAKLLVAAVLIAGALLPATPLQAQGPAQGPARTAWPVKPLRWIAPYPPGGSSDLVARAVGTRLAEQLGQPVLIDNRPGVGGALGSAIAARSAPDGYTLLLANIAPLAIAPHIHSGLGYEVARDFDPVTLLATGPTILVVGPSLQVKTVAELIALARAKPGLLKYGSGGSGTPAHLTTELLRMMTGTDLVHVPYKGTGQSVTDLLGGHIDFVFASMPITAAHVKAGRLRAIAASSAKRTSIAPDLPTMDESGVPGFDMVTWWGVVVPARTSASIIDRLNASLRKSLAFADTKERFTALGIDVQASSPDEFRKFMAAEHARYARMAKEVGLKAD